MTQYFVNPLFCGDFVSFRVDEPRNGLGCVELALELNDVSNDFKKNVTALRLSSNDQICQVLGFDFQSPGNIEYDTLRQKLKMPLGHKKQNMPSLCFLQARQKAVECLLSVCYEYNAPLHLEFLATAIFDEILTLSIAQREHMPQLICISLSIASQMLHVDPKINEKLQSIYKVREEDFENQDFSEIVQSLEDETSDLILSNLFDYIGGPHALVVTSFFFLEAQLLTGLSLVYDHPTLAISAWRLAQECLHIRLSTSLPGISFQDSNSCKTEMAKLVRIILIVNLSCVIRKYQTEEKYRISLGLRHSSILQQYSSK